MSNLSEWCYHRGMSFQEYETLDIEIGNEAGNLFSAASLLRKTGTGMYYPVEELVPEAVRSGYEARGLLDYLFAALVACGVEFYDNRSLYRI